MQSSRISLLSRAPDEIFLAAQLRRTSCLPCVQATSEISKMYQSRLVQLRVNERRLKAIETENEKHFSCKHFFTSTLEGLSILARGFSDPARKALGLRSSHEQHGVPEVRTSMIFGFRILSKLASVFFLHIPYFLMDVQVGLKPSFSFVLMNYVALMVGVFFLVIQTKIVTYLATADLLYRMEPRKSDIFYRLSEFVVICYPLNCFFVIFWLLVNRNHLRDFLLYESSCIQLDSNWQTKVMWKQGTSFVLGAMFAEPLFVVITFVHFDHQVTFSYLTEIEFYRIKLVLGILATASACYSTLHEQLIPTILSYMSTCFEKQIKDQVEGTLNQLMSKFKVNLATHDERFHELHRSHGLSSLSDDWPELEDEHRLNRRVDACELAILLRVYKALIKLSCNLRIAIGSFESRFGFLHVMLLCRNGLLIAHYALLSLMQVRLSQQQQQQQQQVYFLPRESRFSSFIARAVIGFVALVVSNWAVFMRYNRLPECQLQLRHRLFGLSLELARMEPDFKQHDQDLLELTWSKYDHLKLVSEQTNFSLVRGVFYHKRCLLLILSQVLSLTLLYIQVMDIYIG